MTKCLERKKIILFLVSVIIALTIMTILFLWKSQCHIFPESGVVEINNGYLDKFLPITYNNFGDIQSVSQITVFGEYHPVNIIEYNIKSNQLLAISNKEKCIVSVEILSQERAYLCNLNISTLQVIEFDEHGEMLLAALIPRDKNTGEVSVSEYIDGIALWDISTGELIECFSVSCSETLEESDGDIGAVLDPKSRYVIVFGEYSYNVYSMSPGIVSQITLVNSLDEDYWWRISKIGLDSRRNRIAIAYEEGRVELNSIANRFPFNRRQIIEVGKKHRSQKINFVKFSPDGEYLLIARGDFIDIWRLGVFINKKVYSSKFYTLKGVVFPHSQEFVAIGDENLITVIFFSHEGEVKLIDAPGITTLTISDDDKLLFWGDAYGNVHLWGVPQE